MQYAARVCANKSLLCGVISLWRSSGHSDTHGSDLDVSSSSQSVSVMQLTALSISSVLAATLSLLEFYKQVGIEYQWSKEPMLA